ncbi:hypothetical protein [Sporosarcina highlanderae]|uniref:Uncharacterized protein n=1 Tax=Sporosarcina highlanderae TaxID=3035916 RepID=A0ABT8JRE3_9BACL|nr:hypothetical protein [Sporosarcina highlanderae]MDN4607363.1 hypothetical protein [Sporosarcina highlanderae]
MGLLNCDDCKAEFTVKKIKSKKAGIYKGNNVRFNYFDSPKCKKKYFVGAREQELNKIIAKLKRIQKKMGTLIGSGNLDELERLQSECEKLKSEIEAYGNMLKNMFVLK